MKGSTQYEQSNRYISQRVWRKPVNVLVVRSIGALSLVQLNPRIPFTQLEKIEFFYCIAIVFAYDPGFVGLHSGLSLGTATTAMLNCDSFKRI